MPPCRSGQCCGSCGESRCDGGCGDPLSRLRRQGKNGQHLSHAFRVPAPLAQGSLRAVLADVPPKVEPRGVMRLPRLAAPSLQ